MSRCLLSVIWLAATPVFASAQWTAAAYIGKANTTDADVRVTSGTGADVVLLLAPGTTADDLTDDQIRETFAAMKKAAAKGEVVANIAAHSDAGEGREG